MRETGITLLHSGLFFRKKERDAQEVVDKPGSASCLVTSCFCLLLQFPPSGPEQANFLGYGEKRKLKVNAQTLDYISPFTPPFRNANSFCFNCSFSILLLFFGGSERHHFKDFCSNTIHGNWSAGKVNNGHWAIRWCILAFIRGKKSTGNKSKQKVASLCRTTTRLLSQGISWF